jgi:hypothetical protein
MRSFAWQACMHPMHAGTRGRDHWRARRDTPTAPQPAAAGPARPARLCCVVTLFIRLNTCITYASGHAREVSALALPASGRCSSVHACLVPQTSASQPAPGVTQAMPIVAAGLCACSCQAYMYIHACVPKSRAGTPAAPSPPTLPVVEARAQLTKPSVLAALPLSLHSTLPPPRAPCAFPHTPHQTLTAPRNQTSTR